MKLSCLPVSLFEMITRGEMTIHRWAETAWKVGFDGFDISSMFIKNHTPVYLCRLKKVLEQQRIPLVMMTAYPDFTVPDSAQRDREEAYFLADLAAASQLGCRYLRITAGQTYPGTDQEKTMENVIEIFKRMREASERAKVRLVYENHGKPSAWKNFDFTYDPEQFLKICSRLKPIDIGINFDIGNATAFGTDPAVILKEIYDIVETVHISDMKEYGKFLPSEIGKGKAPIMNILRFLQNKKFSGWLSIEEASGNGTEGIKAAYSYVRRALFCT